MSLVTLVVGAGVIALPNAVGGAGIIVGFGVVAFCGIISIDTGRILCAAATTAEELGHEISELADIGHAAMGQWGRRLTIGIMQVEYFLTACIFINLAGQYLGMIADTVAGKGAGTCEGVFPLLMELNGVTFGGWMLLAGILLIPTLFMWDMRAIALAAPAGVGGAIVLILCIAIGSFILIAEDGVDSGSLMMVGPPTLDAVISIFCKAVFSFFGAAIVPNIRKSMKRPEKATTAVIGGLSVVTAIYLAVCVPAVLAFGQPSATILNKVNKGLLYVGAAGVVVHVYIALPLILNIFYDTCASTVLPVMKTRNIRSVLIRFAVLACALIFSMIFAKLGALLDLVSALAMSSAMILLPIAFNILILRRKTGSLGGAIEVIGYFSFAWQMVMCTVGLAALVLGTMSAIRELGEPLACPK